MSWPREHDLVLTPSGASGTVVHVYRAGKVCEVELSGTSHVTTLAARDLRPDVQPQLGKVYTLHGNGELLCCGVNPLRFAGHGHHEGSYYASRDEVLREATRADLDARYAQAKPRGVACDDRKCWCRLVK